MQEERSERGWKETDDDVEESVRVNAIFYFTLSIYFPLIRRINAPKSLISREQ